MNLSQIRYPLIIAHRGYSAKYPENTLIAFQAALDSGVQMIELDVALTRDREVVIIHDDTVDRTTNGRGDLNTYSLDELKVLDAGTWFDRRFSGERIPTLAEALDFIGNRACINIEIKSSAYESHHPEAAIERQLVEMVHMKNLQNNVLISSFKWDLLENIRRLDHNLPLALLSRDPVNPNATKIGQRLRIFAWNRNQRKCGADQVTKLHDAGFRVFVYTVNSQERFRILLGMGIDGVFSDDPLHLM